MALATPISLSKLEAFYESLCHPNPYGPPMSFTPNLLINTVDTEENIHIIYCSAIPDWVKNAGLVEPDPATGQLYTWRKPYQGKHVKKIRWEVGTVRLARAMIRSSVLPGLKADDLRYMDGGYAENPVLSLLPGDATLLLLHLGYAGLVEKGTNTTPKGVLDRANYGTEFIGYTFKEYIIERFNNLTAIYPGVYEVPTDAFDLSAQRKQTMIDEARAFTRSQWQVMPLLKQ